MPIRIETPRLIIRELCMDDAEGMFAMDSDPEVHKFLGTGPQKDIQEARDIIAFILKQYEENGIGRWAVELKEDGSFIGWTGWKFVQQTVNGHANEYDFGYRHLRRYWGQGYAYEAAKAALDYGLDVLGFRGVYAMTDVENGASRHILEKLGFEFKEIIPYDGPPFWRENFPVTWYELPIASR